MCTFIYFLSRAGRGKIIWKAVWDGKCDLLSHRLWKPEEHRCTRKVTSVDLELSGDASLYYKLSKLWLEWKLVGTKVFSTLREASSAQRAHCFLGDVAAETEIFALNVRIRAHYSFWYPVLQISSCTGSERGGGGSRCPEIKSYCSRSLNHNNEFSLTRSINYSGLESNTIIQIRRIRREGSEYEDNMKGWNCQSSIVCKSPALKDYLPGLGPFSLEFL